ncbi:reverse transcriptase domain-containing protein [Tanacetum coccineum]
MMYLSASYRAISAVLMTERDTVQTPVYFVSLALQSPEINYTPMEKLVLALVCAAKRLRRYFQAHPIILADFLVEKPDDAPPEASVIETLQEPTDSGAPDRGANGSMQYTVVEEDGPTWMTPIIEYLRDETLPIDQKEASKLRIKARQYELLEGILYRRSFLKPWLRYVGPLQADYVIREIHEGSCSMHAGPRSVVAKAMRSGYYWTTMHRDAREIIRKIDIAGPFSEGPRNVKFLIVAMDYFMKWIEVKAVATIIGNQSNGHVKRVNWSLGEGIKARLGEENKNWIEELPHVLWAYRTLIKSSHGDTPFSLTYGTEAVIPAEIRMLTYRTTVVDAVQ